jgi:predicted NBD/HSP70 family sugar kinase
VLIGPDGFAGEIGHYEADLGGMEIPCSCGTGSNHLGAISSGRGVEAIARAFGGPGGRFEALFRDRRRDPGLGRDPGRLTSEVIAAAADRGDAFCRAVIDFCTGPLAGAVSLLALALYLKRVILIGGFALNCGYYRASLVRNTIRRGIYNATPDRIRRLIVCGEHDDDHALIGAGIMAAAEGAGVADGLRPRRS